jgi:hypothetical protein
MKIKRKKHSRIDWSTVDWAQTNKAISIDIGTSEEVVSRARGRHALFLQTACPTCGAVVDPVTYCDRGNPKKLCRACWCGWNNHPHGSPWTDSMISH